MDEFPNLAKLTQNNIFKDEKAELCFENGSIVLEKTLVADYSDYFYNLFADNIGQTKFEIKNIKLEDFNLYCQYLNEHRTYQFKAEDILNFLNVQKKFKPPYLKIKIKNWFKDETNIVFMPVVFNITSEAKYKYFREYARQLIDTNFDKLVQNTHIFDNLSSENFFDLFNEKFINGKNTLVISNIIASWVEMDFESRTFYWVFLQFKVADLSCNEIKLFFRDHPKARQNSEIMDIFKTILRDTPTVFSGKQHKNAFLFGGRPLSENIGKFDLQNKVYEDIGTLKEKRWFHTSITIGEWIYLFGGRTSSIERFNVNTYETELLSFEMDQMLINLSSANLNDTFYLIGGEDSISVDTVKRFEPEKFTWIESTRLLQANCYHDSISLDNAIYITPGFNCQHVQRLDPRENKCHLLPEIPNKSYDNAVSTMNSNFVCLGGIDERYWEKRECFLFDIIAEEWRPFNGIPYNYCHYNRKACETEGDLFIFGGQSGGVENKIHLYDKVEESWSLFTTRLTSGNCSFSLSTF